MSPVGDDFSSVSFAISDKFLAEYVNRIKPELVGIYVVYIETTTNAGPLVQVVKWGSGPIRDGLLALFKDACCMNYMPNRFGFTFEYGDSKNALEELRAHYPEACK